MKTRLVALDIDGTLIPPHVHYNTVPDAAITSAVQQLMQAGVVVVLATGRMFPGTARIAEHFGISHSLVCQQGASIHELDGQVITRQPVDHAIACELVDFAKERGWHYSWFDAERYLVSTHNEQSQYYSDVSGVEIEIDPEPQRSGIIPTGLDIISTADDAAGVHRELSERYGSEIQLLDFTAVTAAHSPQATKGNAVAWIADELGIAADQVLAIGDSANDASMLQWAGWGAAPAHCDQYARDAADEILIGEGVTGVANLLNQVLDSHR